LLFATAKTACALPPLRLQDGEALLEALAGQAESASSLQIPSKAYVVARGHVREEPPPFGHVRDPQTHDLIGPQPVDTPPFEYDLASSRPLESRDRPHEGRLPGAIGPNDRDQFARFDL
jgi:hypothetical protein